MCCLPHLRGEKRKPKARRYQNLVTENRASVKSKEGQKRAHLQKKPGVPEAEKRTDTTELLIYRE